MNVLTAVTDVFSAIGTWIVETIPEMLSMFYVAETGLTLLGTLAVASLGISIAFLLISIITNFFQFRA